MHSSEIRRIFLDHFAIDHGHTKVDSASLVPSSYDPSILLNTAGMQPFKPYFAGIETPPASRLTSCQKCFRAVDIDEVGLTARHLTFFEMLGNFSFGDYFKAGAIEMAWQLIVDKLKIDLDLLWVTVHEGDAAMGLTLDQEAIDLWVEQGLSRDRIVALGEDNFWKAGATGPCGPSSEIFFDRGEAFGCGSDDCLPGCECDRFLEFYNLVFMQYDRDAAGKLAPLPQQNIDTGMGLERVSSLLQGNVSVFEIDSFKPIIEWAEKVSGRSYGDSDESRKAFRVLCDHGRGMTFLAADGVTPSNEGRGYVLRRVIRRAIQHADRIGMYPDRQPGLLAQMCDLVVSEFGDAYPALREQHSIVSEMLAAEEARFLGTLDKGSKLFDKQAAQAESAGEQVLAGDAAFQLHDTYGFPIELTEELATERGLAVDHDRFSELMQQQRERARAAAGSSSMPVDQAAEFVRKAPPTIFTGYSELSAQTTIAAIEPVAESDQSSNISRVLIKLGRSPLYAEGGGQVADAGVIQGERGQAVVESVLRYGDDQVIIAQLDGQLNADESVTVTVTERDRRATERNHTATHLLHAALREHLGDHVRQAGSLVEPGRLRFDFAHTAAVTADELAQIEASVNERITAGEPVSTEVLDIDVARDRGAMMLFGEKYGDTVRMVTVGDSTSLELCGGTHVSNTAQIRLLIITGESSVGSNTRRIEAVTGDTAIAWLRDRAMAGEAVCQVLNSSLSEVADKASQLQRDVRQLERELASLQSGGAVEGAASQQLQVGPFVVVPFRDDSLDGDQLLDLADRLRGQIGGSAVVMLGSASGGKVSLVVGAGDEAIANGAHAGNLVKVVAGVVGGGGGGRPNTARAGGKDVAKLDEALEIGVGALRDIVAAQ